MKDYVSLASPVAEETRPILISPFIRQGDTFLLVGDRGAGKSTITADFALGLVGPESLPGQHEIVAGAFRVINDIWNDRRVLVMDAENDAAEWREFVDASLEARGVRKGSEIYDHVYRRILWENARHYDWDNLSWLRRWCVEEFIPNLLRQQIGFVVIDSMHAVWTKDLFMPEWVTGGVEFLRAALKDSGITLMCLTHTSRSHKDKLEHNEFAPYGTVRQEQACDTMIGIKRDVENAATTLRLEKRRAGKWNQEKSKVTAKLSPTFGGYTRIISSAWTHEAPEKRPGSELVLTMYEKDLLAEVKAVDVFDLGALNGNRKKNRVIVDSLVSVDILEFIGGKGVKGDPLQWAITDLGRQMLDR